VYDGEAAASWDVDLLPADTEIDETLKLDVLGARKKILFVEGTHQSLDGPLYALLFPDVSIIAKASCRDVELAVVGIRGAGNLHWVRPIRSYRQ
jgi:hypothetical protein